MEGGERRRKRKRERVKKGRGTERQKWKNERADLLVLALTPINVVDEPAFFVQRLYTTVGCAVNETRGEKGRQAARGTSGERI